MPSSRKIVEALIQEASEDELKDMALELPSAEFLELMRNFEKHLRDVYKRAKASHALSGDEPEMLVLKCCLMIAAQDFFHERDPRFKKTLKNLQHFV